jgi:hypothetical protein
VDAAGAPGGPEIKDKQAVMKGGEADLASGVVKNFRKSHVRNGIANVQRLYRPGLAYGKKGK